MKSLTRRSMLERSLWLGAAAMGGYSWRASAEESAKDVVARTTAGAVRGRNISGVNLFKGIPYGESTGGANRFRAPQKVASWSGVRDALDYGPKTFQGQVLSAEAQQKAYEELLKTEPGQLNQGLFRWPLAESSEDCLVLNVWTPNLADGAKRPVMVWLHGGGFSGGSGDWGWTDGSNLARKNDVVVVSLNHRLNVFGYLYLAEIGGAKYAESGNAGVLDIVAALEWVRDNIAAFGGDPGNVTVFGESGGGSKINVLMAMPAAKGLFHKAHNMSGPGLRMVEPEQATQTALAVLKQLHIDPKQVDRIQQTPPNDVLRAMNAVMEADSEQGWRPGGHYRAFAPVVDGRNLPRHPFDPTAPDISAQVPLMIGNCGHEDRSGALRAAQAAGALDDAKIRAHLDKMGLPATQADALMRDYRATRPNVSPLDLFTDIISDLEFRNDAMLIATRKAALNRAPAYMYLLTWESPAFNGKYKSAHAFDIPFVFDNIDAAPVMAGSPPDPRTRRLAAQISRACATFARSGSPNHADLPQWKPYSAEERATMVFDYSCKVVNDPRRADRLALEKLKF